MSRRLASPGHRPRWGGYAAGLYTAVLGLAPLLSGCPAPAPKSRPYQYYATRIGRADSLRQLPRRAYLVFAVSYQYGDSATQDGNVSETLTFPVDSSARAFRLENAALRASGATYEKRCLCLDEGTNRPFAVGQGYVSGTRLAPGTWRFDVQVLALSLLDTVRLGRHNVLNLNTPRPLPPSFDRGSN